MATQCNACFSVWKHGELCVNMCRDLTSMCFAQLNSRFCQLFLLHLPFLIQKRGANECLYSLFWLFKKSFIGQNRKRHKIRSVKPPSLGQCYSNCSYVFINMCLYLQRYVHAEKKKTWKRIVFDYIFGDRNCVLRNEMIENSEISHEEAQTVYAPH